jgi:hypothetical protein
MEELIKHVAADLKENILKHQLPLKETPNLKWSWREEPNMGTFECTIMARIPIETNPISIQSKKHLHWKALDTISAMNNEVKFVAPTHNLLLKKGSKGEDCQAYKNTFASVHASLQAARKKRFTSMDLERS